MTRETGCPPLEVLVPGGRDPFADYEFGVPGPFDPGHPPVNFHAMAAATGGRFHRELPTIPDRSRFVLVLLPRRVRRAASAVSSLVRSGKVVLATWKECGVHQIARQTSRPLAGFWLRRILRASRAVVTASPAAEAFFGARVEAGRLLSIPTPYPLDVPGWSFERTFATRHGVFLGTRDWDTPSRRHGLALELALGVADRTGSHVTVINGNGAAGMRRLRALGNRPRLRVVDGPLPFPAYLEEMARHRIVFQRDRSGVPGQVAGDALLCGMPCLGGDGGIDRMAFPDLPGAEESDPSACRAAELLLTDETAWSGAVAASRERAEAELSFGAFRRTWTRIVEERFSP